MVEFGSTNNAFILFTLRNNNSYAYCLSLSRKLYRFPIEQPYCLAIIVLGTLRATNRNITAECSSSLDLILPNKPYLTKKAFYTKKTALKNFLLLLESKRPV